MDREIYAEQISRREGRPMNNAILYALLLFSVSGVIALWVNIWIIHKRVETLWELLIRCLAELPQQVAADHTQDTCDDTAPKV